MTTKSAAAKPVTLAIYQAASRLAKPVANFALERRLQSGKEDAARLDERRGRAGRPRPDGRLIWIHGASVGESLSIIPLVDALAHEDADAHFLVTTGTVTSASLLDHRLPDRAFHQYIPLDHPDFVSDFLDHWRPDGVLFVESEFWPNLILLTEAKTPFMALVNGRMSPRSFADWQTHPNTIKRLLSAFDVIIAQDRQNADRLQTLSGRAVLSFGNIKSAAAPLPAGDDALAALAAAMADRPRWLSASTHPGEEALVLAAHRQLAETVPGLLTVIAPRHPDRGDELAAAIDAAGLTLARRSAGEAVTIETEVYLADTLGELGLFYRVCDIAFIGGSLTAKGGHNPLEPARLGSAILHGPEIFNFLETYDDLRRAGGAGLVRNDREIASAVRRLLADATTRAAMAHAAQTAAEQMAEKVLADICGALTNAMAAATARS